MRSLLLVEGFDLRPSNQYILVRVIPSCFRFGKMSLAWGETMNACKILVQILVLENHVYRREKREVSQTTDCTRLELDLTGCGLREAVGNVNPSGSATRKLAPQLVISFVGWLVGWLVSYRFVLFLGVKRCFKQTFEYRNQHAGLMYILPMMRSVCPANLISLLR
jgi:hypothetical protein